MSSKCGTSSAATIWNRAWPRGAGLVLAAALLVVAPGGRADTSAVVLMYHHVAEDTPAATSVRPEMFDRHLEYLEDNGFRVWSLPRLVETLQAGGHVPERTVALTFDDAYESVYEQVWPRLRERGWPFTVFVAPADVDAGHGPVADWDQLREMAADGAVIANHSMNHGHLARPRRGEGDDDWLERVRDEIEQARTRLAEELDDAPPALFAWPYGEFSPPAQKLLEAMGLVGFGQHSGAIGPDSDFTALPRFPMAVGFDDPESFALKVHTRPLPVVDTDPASGVMDPDERVPALEVELGEGRFAAERLACYSQGSALEIEWFDERRRRFRVEGDEIVGAGRTRFNCTAPATDADRWYWYSFQWMMPRDDGTWYED